MKKMNKKNKKSILFTVIGVLILIILFGLYYYFNIYSQGVEKPKKKAPEVKELKIVNINSKTRPYGVMINNIGAARPLQSGLQDAYIIYEIIVEGGLTRYFALFLDKDVERIGSVRSARHYYLDYALENDAFYVHHGQSPQAQEQFSQLGIDRIVVDESKTGWRDNTLNVASEHTLFTSTEKLSQGIGSKRTERKGDLLLDYSIDDINLDNMDNAKIANNVEIEYSGATVTSYTYDPETKLYKRYVNDKSHVDYVTKEQYTFKNIITYQVSNVSIDGARQDLKNIGEGKGYYITNGYAVPITWSKSARSKQTIYKYENGKEIKVNDGNTFIQIQPKNKTLTID